MGSVADSLRQQVDEDVSRMSVSERVALALALGEQAVDTFAAANGLDKEEAREILRRNGQHGRRPSVAAGFD